MKYELKRIAVFPVVKVTFFVSLVLGFLLGLLGALFLAPILSAMSRMGGTQMPYDFGGASIGFLIVFMPIIYAVFLSIFNTIGAALAAMMYNFVVKFAGGLELEIDRMDGSAPVQPRPMDVPGAYYAQSSMTPRYAPPPPPTYPAAIPPPIPPSESAPAVPPLPPDPQGDKNRPTQFPFE